MEFSVRIGGEVSSTNEVPPQLAAQGVGAGSYENLLATLKSKIGEHLKAVIPKDDLEDVQIFIDIGDDVVREGTSFSLNLNISVDTGSEAVSDLVLTHIDHYTALYPRLFVDALLLEKRSVKHPTQQIVDFDYLAWLDVIEKVAVNKDRMADGQYVVFEFQEGYYQPILGCLQERFGTWSQTRGASPHRVLVWQIKTPNGREVDIELSELEVSVRTYATGSGLLERADRPLSLHSESEISALKREKERTQGTFQEKRITRTHSSVSKPQPSGKLDIDEVIAQKNSYVNKYQRYEFADWKWHQWLIDKIEEVYGYDEEVVALVQKQFEGLVRRGHFPSRVGKRRRETVWRKLAIRHMLIKYEQLDYLEGDLLNGTLRFDKQPRTGNPDVRIYTREEDNKELGEFGRAVFAIILVLIIIAIGLAMAPDWPYW